MVFYWRWQMRNEPLVSVYMPTHNRSELLARAIKSVITQSYSNIELIICDDGSTDNTYDVVKNLSLKQI
ncbi:glycosyltransferase family 2 protein [Escherichia coli]|uniref:glycosyltransferase family 2 protein n=1 Tax=Escherichia coli TaxID=562 RepID=UPI00338ED1BA